MISVKAANRVLGKLDGWVVGEKKVELGTPEMYGDATNVVTLEDVDEAWKTMLSKAKLYIHDNPAVLQTKLIADFWEAVICWTASELWRKYNHKVKSPGEEGVSTDTRAKDLYFNGKHILDNLRTSRLYGLSD